MQLIGKGTAALARRLLLVALFVFGFGEVPFGSEGPGTRGALDAGRAAALTAADTPPTEFLLEAERDKLKAAGIAGGGEDERATTLVAAPFGLSATVDGIDPQRATTPESRHGFSSRAPPFHA
jgi:hypothetical protein